VSFPGTKGFLGGTVDSSIGLTQLGAREYDPSQGRFLSADPVMQPVKPQQLNPYGYGNGNPVNQIDASGLTAGSWCVTASCVDAGSGSPGLSGYGGPSGDPQNPTPPAQGPVYTPVSTHVAADTKVAQHLRELYAAEISKIAKNIKPGDEIPSTIEAQAWRDICYNQTQMCSDDGMSVIADIGMMDLDQSNMQLFVNACSVDNSCGAQARGVMAAAGEAFTLGQQGESIPAPAVINYEIPPDIQEQMENARDNVLMTRQYLSKEDTRLGKPFAQRTVTGAYDPVSGSWAIGCSGNGQCAETNAAANLAKKVGDPSVKDRSMFIATLRIEKTSVYEMYVCFRCQLKYAVYRFAKGVLGTPNGSWPKRFQAPVVKAPSAPLKMGPMEEEPLGW